METENEKLIKFLDKLYNTAKKADDPWHKTRLDNRKMYKGDQWRRPQAKYKATSVTNYTSKIIREECAIITDNTPQINITPVDSQADPKIAIIIKKLIERLFYMFNFRKKAFIAVKKQSVDGVSYFRPFWNPKLCNGEGDIDLAIESADSVKLDPSGEKNYYILEKKITMAEVNRLYPDKINEVREDVKKDISRPYTKSPKKPSLPVQSTDGSMTTQYEDSDMSIQEQLETVDYRCYWLNDDSVEYLEKDDGTKEEEPTEKFPNGRWIHVANGKTILKDEPCQIKHFPIVQLNLDPDIEDENFGLSTIDYIKPQQLDANEIKALLKDMLRGNAYPRGRASPNSQYDSKKNRNYPGSVANVAPSDMAWDFNGPITGEAFNFQRLSKDDMEDIGAVNNISQPNARGSITSAEGLRLIMESARTIIRPKAMLFETACKELCELILDYMQIGYSVPRVFRIVGEDIKINGVSVEGDVQKVINDITVGQYDIHIEPDSTLPRSDSERFLRVMDLKREGMADREACLQYSMLPNWYEINQRMQVKEDEFKAQQAQQAQAANQPPPPKEPSISVNFKDTPPDAQTQILAKIGIQTSPQSIMANQAIQNVPKETKSPTI